MKKSYSSIIVCACCMLLFPFYATARPQMRAVVRDTICHTSMARMSHVLDQYAYEFQSCPDSLFSWAYLNTDSRDGKHNELDSKGKDAIMLVYKDRSYDASRQEGDVALDIYVLGMRMFKDNHLGTVYSTYPENNSHVQHLRATYSGSLLEGGNIVFHLDSVAPGRTRVQYRFELTFGKFFSSFVSDKTWNNVAEWRMSRIFDNLIEFAETGVVKKME